MKITPHSTSLTNESITSKQTSQVGSEEKNSQKLAKTQDTVKIEESQLAKSAKDTNNAIGSLQVALEGIKKMSDETKTLSKIVKKIQNDGEKHKQEDIQKATQIKSKIQKEFEASSFNDENVFSKNYKSLSPDIKFNPQSIKPSTIDTSDPDSTALFLKTLDTQKKYAQEAIDILDKKLQNTLDNIKKTDSSYESLDKSILKEKEFRDSHKTDGITLERLVKLLG